MINFDLHIHTHWSRCSNLSAREILKTASKRGLDAIAVVDHGTTRGALEVKRVREANIGLYRELEVYLGIEVRTQHGEFNVVFLDEADCPAFDSIREKKGTFKFSKVVNAIKSMRKSGRPLMVGLNHCISLSKLGKRGGFDFEGAIEEGCFGSMDELMNFFDYVEINTNNLKKAESDAAMDLAKKYNRPVLCNTDSHWKSQIGKYFTKGTKDTPRDCIIAAQGGDKNALILPEKINYTMTWYYRMKSGLIRKFKKYKG